jgi:hypothetical protein
MASISIPIGGQMATIEVPDFAMETTQQDVLEQARKTSDALQSIAGAMGISIQTDNQIIKSNNTIANEIKSSNLKNGNVQQIFDKGIDLSSSAMDSLANLTGKEKLSETTSGMLGGMGLGALGAGLGTVFGIMEEYGASLSALRRTGGGLGVDLIELRQDAADVGIGMETLAKITVENGNTIRSMGNSMNTGTSEFLRLSKELRGATKDMGFFGLGANEMGALLVDEMELRRQAGIIYNNEDNARKNLVDGMKDNLKLNEVLAGLNGQDIQERIKARNEFRRNAVVAAASRNMSEEQLKAQAAAIEGLSSLGPSASPVIQKAMENLIAGLPMDKANTAFTQLAAAASENGIDLRSALMNVQGDIISGMDPQAMAANLQALTNSFKNAEVSAGFITRAGAGQEGALLFLTTQQESYATVTADLVTTTQSVEEAMKKFSTFVGDGMAASGFANQMTVAGEQTRALLIKTMTDTLGLAPDGNYAKFMDRLADFPTSDGFKNLLDFVVGTQTFSSGTMGALRLLSISEEQPAGAPRVQQDASVLALIAGIGAAAGNEFAGASKRVLDNVNAVAEFAQLSLATGQNFDITSAMSQEFMSLGSTISESFANLNTFLTDTTLSVFLTNPPTTTPTTPPTTTPTVLPPVLPPTAPSTN